MLKSQICDIDHYSFVIPYIDHIHMATILWCHAQDGKLK